MARKNSSEDEFKTLHGPVRPYLFESTAKPGAKYKPHISMPQHHTKVGTWLVQ